MAEALIGPHGVVQPECSFMFNAGSNEYLIGLDRTPWIVHSPAGCRAGRLGRSLKEFLDRRVDLRGRDIHLGSLEERINTTSAAGELVFHVFGAIAHFERRLVSERTRDGIAGARERGRKPGRVPLDQKTVSAAQTLIEAGLTPGQAAKQLGIGRATAYRIAKAPR